MADFEKVASFKSAEAFQEFLQKQPYHVPFCPDLSGDLKLGEAHQCMGRTIGNRWAILPWRAGIACPTERRANLPAAAG